MRARSIVTRAVLLSLPFVACGRSDMEDELELPSVGGAGGIPVVDGGGSGGVAASGGSGAFGGAAGEGAMGGVAGAGAFAGGGFGGSTGGFGGSTGGFGGSTGGFGGTTGGFGGVGATGGGPTGGFGGVGAVGGTGGVTDGGNFFDAFPFPDSGPIFDCVSCAEKSCKNQVNACYNDKACAAGVVCAATSCGGFNLQCILTCFQGKFQAAIKAFQAFACLAQNCGQSCIGVVTGGGGLPPGPGGGAPGPGAGAAESFSAPRAGGFYGYVTPELSASTGLPTGPVYVPPLEVFDSVGRD